MTDSSEWPEADAVMPRVLRDSQHATSLRPLACWSVSLSCAWRSTLVCPAPSHKQKPTDASHLAGRTFAARKPPLCGLGMGLDPHVLARGEGAVVTCLAKGLKMFACADHSFMLFVLSQVHTQAYSQHSENRHSTHPAVDVCCRRPCRRVSALSARSLARSRIVACC